MNILVNQVHRSLLWVPMGGSILPSKEATLELVLDEVQTTQRIATHNKLYVHKESYSSCTVSIALNFCTHTYFCIIIMY